MSYWPIVPLGSEVKFLSGGTPTKDEAKYWGGDIPWVSSAEMTQRRIKRTTYSVTQDGAKEGSRLVPPGTVLVVVRGMSLAKEFRVSISKRELTFNQDIKAICPKTSVDPYFLFYYLLSQSQAIKDSASEAAHGTKKIDMPVLENWPLPIPPIADQKKIAAVISTYDDLIENNQRRIALLEKMAGELYREWFVRLRFPGHEQAKFEKGMPEEWGICRVDSIGRIVTGKTPSTEISRYYGRTYPFIKTPDMHGNMFVFKTEEMLTEDGINSQPSQTIPENSICVSCIGTGGIVTISTAKSQTNQQINTIILEKSSDLEWAFFTIRNLKETIYMFGSTGTTMTNLSKGKFSSLKIIKPDNATRVEFHKKVHPIFLQIKLIAQKSNLLINSRDMLLGRLISGKFSVDSLDIHFPPSMQDAA